jgi:hypothetical protein
VTACAGRACSQDPMLLHLHVVRPVDKALRLVVSAVFSSSAPRWDVPCRAVLCRAVPCRAVPCCAVL